MAKRFFDIVVSGLALFLLLPVLGLIAVGIRMSSRGPILYKALRVGLRNRQFIMFKFRTMHVDRGEIKCSITAKDDPRVFPFGRLLRKLKFDEFPQFCNVLRGDMSLIGPRPEDPVIVENHYSDLDKETLSVLPGLASPGSIYNYTHGEILLGSQDPENAYLTKLMPIKLAMDVVYVRKASFFYDLRLIVRTVLVISALACGKKTFPIPPEIGEAKRLLLN